MVFAYAQFTLRISVHKGVPPSSRIYLVVTPQLLRRTHVIYLTAVCPLKFGCLNSNRGGKDSRARTHYHKSAYPPRTGWLAGLCRLKDDAYRLKPSRLIDVLLFTDGAFHGFEFVADC